CTLEAIQEQADVLSFHVPQNKETLYYFDSAFLKSMKKPFYLLNLSRGKIVDTKALVEGLSLEDLIKLSGVKMQALNN
ncbi:MAG: phosphoglycerate dehydrogenase, partial [Oxalobacteraceae bacterium]|nr:phosphoglycerate dehydrogenase [Oxalobacteraceae bacterium]